MAVAEATASSAPLDDASADEDEEEEEEDDEEVELDRASWCVVEFESATRERAPDALLLALDAAGFEAEFGAEAGAEKKEAAADDEDEDEGIDDDGAYFEPRSGPRAGSTREAMTGAMPLLGEIRNGYDECCERPLSSGKANEAVLKVLMLAPRMEAEAMGELFDGDRLDARMCRGGSIVDSGGCEGGCAGGRPRTPALALGSAAW